jgi:hypothetical protein
MQGRSLEHFRAKRLSIRMKKMRQNKNLEPHSDSMGADMALAALRGHQAAA